jgi:hypothetical protein
LRFRCTDSHPQGLFNFTALTPEAFQESLGFKMRDPPELDAKSLLGLKTGFTATSNQLKAVAKDFEVARGIVHFSVYLYGKIEVPINFSMSRYF